MGLFNRKQNDSTPADPAMTEKGREYAIAKRHGDRKTANRLIREIGSDSSTENERTAFWQGADNYDNIPPAYSKRRNRR
ncbi:hypothetical protein [Streptomyces noursei]|uniref:hypothetical protein n=1 Tax=Streptomyces noursei TaxID=1971 RepID=UPI001674BA20|nr:hypothetical protein [Streptomyces noursei]MCZ1016317.1 hypothetical protein [Streptomyces noursei]GGX00587.1 hypothetical protein GCM10010341_22910 [Streptomyces noursei]